MEKKQHRSRSRANGEGTIFYIESKDAYRASYWITDKITGLKTRKFIQGKKRKDVVAKLNEALNQIENKTYVEKQKVTLIEVCDNYIEQLYSANKISPITYKRKKDTKKVVSTLSIANMPIQDITILDINNSLKPITRYANTTIEKITGLISSAFNYALINNIVKVNPFSIRGAIIRPTSKTPDKKVEAFTIEEQQAFLKQLSVSEDDYKDIFYIASFTGMRIGEILSLKGSDIDIENKLIRVQRTITKDENDKIIIGDTPKTYAGLREIPILDILLPIMTNLSHKDLCFTYKGSLIAGSTINAHFKRICKNAGLGLSTTTIKHSRTGKISVLNTSKYNTHMLRHTFATRCIESGMSAVTLSRILGHKDIETTLNTYTSVFNKFKKEEMSNAEAYLMDIMNKKVHQ